MLTLLLAVTVTHGVSIGEVSAREAILWSRSSEPAAMRVELDEDANFQTPRIFEGRSEADEDFTARITLTELEPSTTYHYRVRFDDSDWTVGRFRTAPARERVEPLAFVVMGDLGGHGYCREDGIGYAIFSHMEALEPRFLVANGDMIYADSDCPRERSEGGRNVPGDFPKVDDPSVDWTDADAVREIYLAHWRYNRADPHFQSLLAKVPIYVQWDDHEVINDFGAAWPTLTAAVEREGYPVLVREGRKALFDFHPLKRPDEGPPRIYRAFRWGQLAELFLLDARSYRSSNVLTDSPDNAKTLLGREQLAWLKSGLARSDATWKIVSTDVPLSIPTGSRAHEYGRDAWANGTAADYSARTGFERELRELLEYLDAEDVTNVVFVATDVHFAMSLRYEVDLDGDGEKLLFHELISGPLSAVRVPVQTPDPTFRPRVLYAEDEIFNFGYVRIEPTSDGTSRLYADIRDETGAVRVGSALELVAQ